MLNNFGQITAAQLMKYLEALKLIVEHGSEVKEFAEEFLPNLPELLKGQKTAELRNLTFEQQVVSQALASFHNERHAAQPSVNQVLESILRKESDQWIEWRDSLPGSPNPELSENMALSFSGLLDSWATASSFMSQLPKLPAPTQEQLLALQEKGHGIPAAIVLRSHLNALWDRYSLRDLPPQIQLANMIHYRNGLLRLEANSALIQSLNVEIGRLAHTCREYWLTH